MKKIFLPLIIFALLGGLYFTLGPKTPSSPEAKQNGGDVMQVDAGSTYTNEKYGFHFTYPKGWHIGSDNLGRGALQLFNYDESLSSGSGFLPGTNKIEAVITSVDTYESSSDYPDKSHTVTEVTVAGRAASRAEVELSGGEKMLSYFIPLGGDTGKTIAITIYGDPVHFPVLETLLESFEFLN